jgi:hypothetical protein
MYTIIRINCFLLIAGIGISSRATPSDELYDKRHIPSGCTIITVSKGDSVFFGGNDDYINPDSYYWAEPGDSSRYGVIWIGTPDNPQQGVNEKGLAYDANGLPRVNVNPHTERIPVPGEYHNYCMQILHECATVDEVISWVDKHQRPPYMHDQLHFADAKGNAVIISAGQDGEIAFTRKAPGDGFLVSSNFNVTNPSNGFSYPCWRYEKAQELLGQLIKRSGPITAKDVTNVMDAVHMEKGASWTIETLVADLVNGEVYIYYYYQFDKPVILNVRSELSDPREPGPLSRLYTKDVQQEAISRYNMARANIRINKIIGISWPSFIIAGLILLFLFNSGNRNKLRFWLPAAIVLGPVALVVRFLVVKKNKDAVSLNAVIETLGNLIPLVFSYTLSLGIIIISMLSGSITWQYQIMTMFGLPVILSLVFHVAFLAPVSNRNWVRFLIQRIPQVLGTTFMGLGGIIPVAMFLVNKSLTMSLLLPLSPFPVITWWAIVVLGALPGGLFIFIYEKWAVTRGYRSWTVLAGTDGEVITPGWKKLWLWILIGIVILFAGLLAGVVLAK